MMEHKKTKTHINPRYQLLIALIGLLVTAVLLTLVLKQNHYYASGYDAWGHIFKSQLMYKSLSDNQFYPIYTPLWYNGLQPFRYWAPFSYYVLAVLFYITGSMENAYYILAGLTLFMGGLPWLLWGRHEKKWVVGFLIGVSWFFLPENMRVFFCEGNIPRIVTSMIIPWIIYFIWRFIVLKKDKAIIGVVLLTTLLTLTHIMIAAMLGIGTFIFFLIYSIKHHEVKREFMALLGVIVGILLAGIWCVPALAGGIVELSKQMGNEMLSNYSYDLAISLDPFGRISGNINLFYYGISFVIVAIIGILLSKKNDKSGYVLVLISLLLTTTSFIPVLLELPLNKLLWMVRLTSIAYAFFFWSLLEWRTIKKFFSIFLMCILIIDCLPSLNISRYYISMKGEVGEEVEIAKKITKQRIALFDLSSYGAYVSYALCQGEDGVNYTYGWSWQGATTAENIVLLNTAIEEENYFFAFDRCLSLGNDTVILPKARVGIAGKTEEDVFNAAAICGYKLYYENSNAYIFHQEMPDAFGVKTDYIGIAIGDYANVVQLKYPNFTFGQDNVIDHYDFETLSKYKIVFLSGFTYNNMNKAETLINELTNAGVRVIIDGVHIPIHPVTRRMTFMGVTAEDITFNDRFPTLEYKGRSILPQAFRENEKTWSTKFLDGVKEEIGVSYCDGEKLVFWGTGENENLIWIGFNLFYHALSSEDKGVIELLSEIMDTPADVLPARSIIPLEITYDKDKIIINKKVSGEVNTTLAYQDNFISKDWIADRDHLLVVSDEQTVVKLRYPHFLKGMLITICGVLSFIGLLLWIRKSTKKQVQTIENSL